MKPRTKLGKSLAGRMESRAEFETYWNGGGGCSFGSGVIVCRDPEYGYGMTVFAELHERDQQHAFDEPELGHRAAAFLEVAHDAWLAMSHAIKRCRECGSEPVASGDYMLASLWECPMQDIRQGQPA